MSAAQVVAVAALSVLLSFSSPGIPSGGLLIMAPVLESVGLPVEGVGILMAVDIFPDAVRTMLNVTADAVAATVVANHSGEVKIRGSGNGASSRVGGVASPVVTGTRLGME